MDYKSYFKDLVSYEDYHLRCTLLGKKPNDRKILKSDLFHEVEGHFWTTVSGHIMFIDPKSGEEEKNVKINGRFSCSDNDLTSLEGAPQKVSGDFYCPYNNLTSLVGAPQKVSGSFYCTGNNLTSLEGAPQKISGNFYCSDNNLTSKSIDAYKKFLIHPTPDHICNTGHYKP